ncbi:MAG TPA: hypothetical protein VGK67_34225 [Myxococcales bacterium]|jgi:hypothetical protein
MLTRVDLERAASASGFVPETLEKVLRLLELLDGMRSHPFLKTRIDLLTSDAGVQELVSKHPGLKWKAINVRKHFGLAAAEES